MVNKDGTVVCEVDDDTIPSDTVWQRRISTACAAGSSIRVVNQDGSVACEFDDLPDSVNWQRRVNGACPAGQSIRVIAADGTVTCEVDDDTIPVDTTWQRRVTATCPPGQSIRVILQDGTVVCEVDDDTLPADNVWQRRVTGTCDLDNSIRVINQDGTVTCDADNTPLPVGRTLFIHWGRNRCDSAANNIYSGWMAGAYYSHHGSGYNTLCMGTNAEYNVFDAGNQDGALLYRAETQFSGYFDGYLNYMQDRDIACAVCESPDAATLMVPGRISCPGDFRLQYYGWLTSNHYTHNGPQDFICLDFYPEAIPAGSAGNEDGMLLYPVETNGPPSGIAWGYRNDREVPCAVCTLTGSSKTTYVQWGKRKCTVGSNVYSGWMAGDWYAHQGSASEMLCMASFPDYPPFGFNDANNDPALLYRTEIESSGLGISSLNYMHNQDVACSVCMVPSNAVIMIPGRINCPASYARQYQGWIMSNHFSHPKPHIFLCMDQAPDAIEGNDPGDNNGALMYPTEAEGPPLGYTHNREVSCVVCAAPTPKVSTFVRWGRNSCSGITNIREIYAGWAAGGHPSHAGSGANYLCMANNPEYLAGFNDGDQNGALLYRAEYRTAGYGVSTLASLNNQDVPCSVCEITAEKVQMIPGRRTCPAGFTLMYEGYLMSYHYTQLHRGEFICLDRAAEPLTGGSANNEDGAPMFPTETESPPGYGYVHDREVTCVVCALNLL